MTIGGIGKRGNMGRVEGGIGEGRVEKRGWQGLDGGNEGDRKWLKSSKEERTRTHNLPHSRGGR